MLKIEVRQALDHEKLNIDEEAEDLPAGVDVFDSCDWDACFFMCLRSGDWVVTIEDPLRVMMNMQAGTFILQMGDDAGFRKRLV